MAQEAIVKCLKFLDYQCRFPMNWTERFVDIIIFPILIELRLYQYVKNSCEV